jgi:hypothetical protein
MEHNKKPEAQVARLIDLVGYQEGAGGLGDNTQKDKNGNFIRIQ